MRTGTGLGVVAAGAYSSYLLHELFPMCSTPSRSGHLNNRKDERLDTPHFAHSGYRVCAAERRNTRALRTLEHRQLSPRGALRWQSNPCSIVVRRVRLAYPSQLLELKRIVS